MFSEFHTAWKHYSHFEMDRFELDGKVVYIARDRTCVFVQENQESPAQLGFRQAAEEELHHLWDRHRLVALLPVFRNLRAQRPA